MSRVFLLLALPAMALAACAGTTNGEADRPGTCVAGSEQPKSADGLEQITLCLRSKPRTHSFTVEMARTSQEQAQGLMFRTALADGKGMLFPFGDARQASFWMKNTLIPLDIIFIKADGRIANIAENTTPYSTTPVTSVGPVKAVLELRGGLTRELGIKAGDTAIWQAAKDR
jgi:uncharacterized protein